MKDALLQRRGVRLMIETDKRASYRQIWASLGIDMSQVPKILHNHLAVRKPCIQWIPHNLIEAQKLRRDNLVLQDDVNDLPLHWSYLYRTMKERLPEKWFTDAEDTAYEKAVKATPKCKWAKCYFSMVPWNAAMS
ncbi:hypothetical protein EVAR_84613_1 [Eumeta japonica]|uniref:Mariner Mos1 transposase n=1 Tax=Eumeta variegata TaxID=151549 RepID=A0A4C1UYD5_EUMVA|nr:hypothetical protein EVAR_84613_1 [Eumeta japonica]